MVDKAGVFYLERLLHFNCPHCMKWWAIGDADVEKKQWFCPWCGKAAVFDLSKKSEHSGNREDNEPDGER